MRHATRSYRRVLMALAGALALHACGDSPTTPTPPPPVPDPPKVTCPAAMTLLSPQATPIPVLYGTATVANGAPPVTLVCSPASGTIFPTGPTTVTCTATDSRQRTDSCSFPVVVNVPPKISATRYLAFGDSMTAGEIVSEGSGFSRTLKVVQEKAYPADLQRDLTDLYQTQAQAISVANKGNPQETAVDGYARLHSLLTGSSWEVLTLMDGANDLGARDLVIAQAGVDAIRIMVQDAKSRGLKVFLATLPPQNPNGYCPNRGLAWSLVEPFNDRLRSIASSENVRLVDVYQAFNGDTTTLIDCDGLHPTAAGYQVIADAFFKAIRQDLQVSSPSSFRTSPFLPMLVRPRRR